YVEDGPTPKVEIHPHDPETEARQIAGLNKVRAERDDEKLTGLLEQLQEAAKDESQNLMPITIELVKAGASMGDIVECLREIWGTYRETPVI
ncbi:MAG: methylmalonyl-CoA mutase, partial [Alphaproteobacteria bacterium]|nr:methylmalonyl-CoA mutase [Alphaproteobacteria bacterium]